ncbi:MAG: hypothetical protein Q9211_006920 [Gyalolechia sp. 1 TL-2023]
MSTPTVNCLPTVHIFEDGRSASAKQITFPYRRHRSSLRKTRSTAPATRWKQQTLTQITPTLAHVSSSHSSFDGTDELEYDRLDLAMPPKKRPRKSGTPKPKSKPQQKQTITQMDPFKQQIYPPEDVGDRADDHVLVPATVPSRKKRKSTSITPTASTVQTRSSKRMSGGSSVDMEAKVPSDLHKQDTSDADPEAATLLPESQDLQMPPPKTPRRPGKKVVPSSQSPAETPISTHGRRKEKDQNVTPLGERSVNTPSKSRLFNRRKSVQWAPKLVVADSTNWEDEDSETLFPPIVRNRPSEQKLLSPQLRSPSNQPMPRTPSSVERFLNNLFRSPHLSPRRPNSRTIQRKATIADSEDEGNSLSSGSPEQTNNSPSRKPDRPRPSRNVSDKSGPPTPPNHQTQDTQRSRRSPQDVQRETSFGAIPTQLVHPQNENAPPAFEHTTTHGQDTPNKHSSDTEEASAQLENELLQSSSPVPARQPPVLETESQFDNAWRELTPPQLDLEDEHAIEQPAEPTLPTIPPPTRNGQPTDLPTLPPIPPSQATTTDITQATPHRTRLNNDSRTLVSSPAQHPQPFLSSSSSPFRPRKEQAPTTFMGYQGWNGVRMTDSQLLPQSFLDDSLELPPMFGDEDLDLEEE